MRRGIRNKKRRHASNSISTPTISGVPISVGKIEHQNTTISREMLKNELLRLLEFRKALGIDLKDVEGEVLERLQVMETRDDLGFTPLN